MSKITVTEIGFYLDAVIIANNRGAKRLVTDMIVALAEWIEEED